MLEKTKKDNAPSVIHSVPWIRTKFKKTRIQENKRNVEITRRRRGSFIKQIDTDIVK